MFSLHFLTDSRRSLARYMQCIKILVTEAFCDLIDYGSRETQVSKYV